MQLQVLITMCLSMVIVDSLSLTSQDIIPIIRQINHIAVDGTYSFAYETGNEIYAEEQGFLKNLDKGSEAQVAQGQVQYQSPEGETIRLIYTADENGFHPQGAHLPVAPPVPPLIKKALKLLESLEQTQANDYHK